MKPGGGGCSGSLALCLLYVLCTGTAVASPPLDEERNASSPRSPNFVLVLFDDLGVGIPGAYRKPGSLRPRVHTPVLDRLAAGGLRFTQAYASGSVCTPARAALLTGRYPQAVGLRSLIEQNRSRTISRQGLLPDVVTLSQLLKEHGYATGHFGKWHLGAGAGHLPSARGFDHSLINAPGRGIHSARSYWNRELLKDGEQLFRSEEHFDKAITDHAIEFVRDKAQRPFFLNLWYNAPHPPFDVPPAALDRYPPSLHQEFAALATFGDTQLGRLIDALEGENLLENTVVFVTSDHGGSYGSASWVNEPLRGDKGNFFEGGIRVPFIVRWDGHTPAASVSDAFIVGHDVFPTIAELAKIDVSTLPLDGRSFAETLESGSAPPRQAPVFWDSGSSGIDPMAAREGPFKLVRFAGSSSLHDLRVDTHEDVDLSQFPIYRPIAASLFRAYLEWRRRVSAVPWVEARSVGQAQAVTGGFRFAGGAVEIEPAQPIDVHDGEFTLECRVLIERRGTIQRIAELPGSWALSLDAGDRIGITVFGMEDKVASITDPTPAATGREIDVAFTFSGRRKKHGLLDLYIDGRHVRSDERVRALRQPSGPLRLGSAEKGELPMTGSVLGLALYSARLNVYDRVGRLREACDLDRDFDCDAEDARLFPFLQGACFGDAKYNVHQDANLDGCVTREDRVLLLPEGAKPE